MSHLSLVALVVKDYDPAIDFFVRIPVSYTHLTLPTIYSV